MSDNQGTFLSYVDRMTDVDNLSRNDPEAAHVQADSLLLGLLGEIAIQFLPLDEAEQVREVCARFRQTNKHYS